MQPKFFYTSLHKSFNISEQAILTTIFYSDIFSFPLNKDELWKFLISEKKISKVEFEKGLFSLKKVIVRHQGFYCLSGREEIIAKRIRNVPEIEKKMQKARWVVEKLSRIPSILFIGVSGGLAVGNVSKNDDIDLVIIVKKNTLFISRLIVLFILQRLGVRRSRTQKNTADTICVNLLFDETALGWFGKYKNVYIAREIAQMVPLFERNEMYKKFLFLNKWIENFLPNTNFKSTGGHKSHPGKRETSASRIIEGCWTLQEGYLFHRVASQNDSLRTNLISNMIQNSFFESLSRSLQTSIMKGHQTNEIVTKHILAFHPNDYKTETLRQLRLKMRQFGLLTKF